MCTVTFIPTAKGVYLSSNRDENKSRGIALPPKQYRNGGHDLICPKDPDAGGSWIAMKENGDTAVLLNGAFVKHKSQPSYRKSRGLIFLDIFGDPNPCEHFSTIALDDIEPFTLVLFSKGQLWECRWDGYQKHFLLLDAARPYIWSSATLYNDDAVQERKRWFLEWFSSVSSINTEKILGFHQHGGKGPNRLVINRGDNMRTVSITTVFVKTGTSQMHYHDLQTGVHTIKMFTAPSLPAKETLFQKMYRVLKTTKIRMVHWEYWPRHLLYGPLYLYWCWLSLKARSLFFFSAANPGIAYSGFMQERKSDIYPLIPQQYYPRTKLCMPGGPAAGLMQELTRTGLTFPLIAKPDMGEKGLQVKLLQSEEELNIYCSQSKVSFLLQEFIPYAQEAGIFYYRIPGEAKGSISGIVCKEFLAVTGDGKSDIGALLKREDRFLLQLSALKYTYGDFLNTVLADKEQYILVPYGNHSRGAKFTDQSYRITAALTHTIDRICQQIPGFYYGRLDIKFNSWAALAEGRNFSIIELNGAGSEPTHIYDPAHSLFFAWKEIARHWRLLYKISILNAQRKKLSLMNTSDGIKMIRNHYQYLKQIAQV